MPYRRRRSTFRRRRGRGVTKAVKKYVKKSIKVAGPLKRYNTSHDFGGLGTVVETFNQFQRMTQGDDNNERLGTRVMGVGLQVRARIELPLASDSAVVRIILFAPEDPGVHTGSPSTVTSCLSSDFHAAQRLLLDRTYTINAGADGSARNTTRMLKFWIPYRRVIQYANHSTGEPVKNQIVMWALSDDSTNQPTCQVETSFLYRNI